MIRFIITIIICLLIFLSPPSFAIRIGDDAPDILGRMTNKKLFKLSSYSGQIRLVNFFSVHCKPCKKELPELSLLEKEFPDIVMIAVHIGDQSIEKVNQFLSDLSGSPKRVVCSSMAVKTNYGFLGFPHTVIIDKHDRIHQIIPGYQIPMIKKY